MQDIIDAKAGYWTGIGTSHAASRLPKGIQQACRNGFVSVGKGGVIEIAANYDRIGGSTNMF